MKKRQKEGGGGDLIFWKDFHSQLQGKRTTKCDALEKVEVQRKDRKGVGEGDGEGVEDV